MGGQFRCLTLALVEPSCRMGQRLRLPMSATFRVRAAVHGDGRRGTLRDRVPHADVPSARHDHSGDPREGVQGLSASFDLGGRVR